MKKFFFKRKKLIYLILLLSNFQNSYAVFELVDRDTRAFSLGDLHALGETLRNPAAITLSKQKEIGIDLFNRYQMKELNTALLYAKFPSKWIDTGISLSSFGYSDYQLTAIQFSFAKQISSQLSLGTHVLYMNECSLLMDERKSYYSGSVGIWYIFNEQIHLGALVEHLLNNYNNRFNSSLGIKYIPYSTLFVFIEGSYKQNQYFNFSMGCEYFLLEQFILRLGFQNNPKAPSFGISYLIKNWEIDTGFSFHSVLGVNSSIGLRIKV